MSAHTPAIGDDMLLVGDAEFFPARVVARVAASKSAAVFILSQAIRHHAVAVADPDPEYSHPDREPEAIVNAGFLATVAAVMERHMPGAVRPGATHEILEAIKGFQGADDTPLAEHREEWRRIQAAASTST